jgi:hypothetical protein
LGKIGDLNSKVLSEALAPRFFEIAILLVRLDHVATVIVNADHSIVRYQPKPYVVIGRNPM